MKTITGKVFRVLSFVSLFASISTIIFGQNLIKQSSLSLSELLAYSTVRIEGIDKSNYKVTGTGFFFCFPYMKDRLIPVIVTNKHVIKDLKSGIIYFSTSNKTNSKLILSQHKFIITDFEKAWRNHPSEKIDIAVMPIGSLIDSLFKKNKKPNIFYLDKTIIPTQNDLENLSTVEDILMVGYPKGLWDSVNNLPLFRKGITATHPAIKYNGLDMFVIDAACFPGSSGSPVFLYNSGNYVDKSGKTIFANRLKLLGILTSGPKYNINGKIQVFDIPTRIDTIVTAGAFMNLGNVIRAEKILDFESLLKSEIVSNSMQKKD